MNSNPLVAIAATTVVLGLVVYPTIFLDGRAAYISFVFQHLDRVMLLGGAWFIGLYWMTRRVAAVVFYREAGEKLRVRDHG